MRPLRVAVGLVIAAHALFGLGAGLGLQLVVFMPLENAHLPYEQSVWIYGAYGILSSIVYFASSVQLDRLPALRLGFGCLVAGAMVRAALFFPAVASSAAVSSVLLAVALPLTDTISGATLYLAFQRILRVDLVDEGGLAPALYERSQQRFIYLMYGIGNVVAIIDDVAYDLLRHTDAVDAVANGNRYAAICAAMATGLAALCVLGAQALVRVADHAPAAADVKLGARPCGAAVQDPAFRRFFFLCLVLIGVRALYRNFDTTLALFIVHTYGEEAHFSLIQMVNPATVILLLPLFMWALENVSDYTLFVAGTAVSSVAPMALAAFLFFFFGPTTTMTTAGNTDLLYWALVVMVFLFTVGECLWSPRLPNYALSKSPVGSTALFLATSTLPTLLAKVVATLLSYWLMPMYCSSSSSTAPAPCNGVILWTVLGLVSAATPIGLLLFERCVQQEKEVEENNASL